MLVELGGTGKIPTTTHHPGCVRFLHRSPASNDIQAARRATPSRRTRSANGSTWWRRRRRKMMLYINGDLVAAGIDDTPLPPGLRIAMGNCIRLETFAGSSANLMKLRSTTGLFRATKS